MPVHTKRLRIGGLVSLAGAFGLMIYVSDLTVILGVGRALKVRSKSSSSMGSESSASVAMICTASCQISARTTAPQETEKRWFGLARRGVRADDLRLALDGDPGGGEGSESPAR